MLDELLGLPTLGEREVERSEDDRSVEEPREPELDEPRSELTLGELEVLEPRLEPLRVESDREAEPEESALLFPS